MPTGAGQPAGRTGARAALVNRELPWDPLCAANTVTPDATVNPQATVQTVSDVPIIVTR
jgi:hypothetical protein